MSFREKSAWISLISILVVTALFFMQETWTLTDPRALHALLLCFVALVLIEIVGHVVVAIQAPRDARTSKDERERLIDLKATRIAFYAFAVGAFGAISLLHVGASAVNISYHVLLAFAGAEIVSYAARIYFYRRGI
jgi:archaellum biogenesis protein FlaJ (TadC family)